MSPGAVIAVALAALIAGAALGLLAGFLLAHLGHIPVAGESVDYEGRRYTIAEMAGRRISRVNVETIQQRSLTQPPPDENDRPEAIA